MLRRYARGLVFLAAGLAAACDGSSPSEPRPGRALLTLTAPSTAAPGQAVAGRLTVLNDGDEPLDLTFGSSCPADLVVESGGARVWNLMAHTICLQSVTTHTLRPGRQLLFDLEWDQTTNDGARVQPGTYTLRGVLLANEEPKSAPVTLAIR